MPKEKVRKIQPVSAQDLVTLSANLRARETKLLTPEHIQRMLEAARYEEACRIAAEFGYPDLSGLDSFGIERALAGRRLDIFQEIEKTTVALPLLDMFRLKYDYHNVKTLVKSMRANEDASRILSECGRVPAAVITEAFISGERSALPEDLRHAIHQGVSVLSRTSNPQLSDLSADKLYFATLSELAVKTGGSKAAGYARLIIDSANLRTFVRAKRTQRPDSFLPGALFDGGNAKVADFLTLPDSGEGLAAIITERALHEAAVLAPDAIAGAPQTAFERACDNAVYRFMEGSYFIPFGVEVVLEYLIAFEWEITSVRTALLGKLAGIEADILKERIRNGNV